MISGQAHATKSLGPSAPRPVIVRPTGHQKSVRLGDREVPSHILGGVVGMEHLNRAHTALDQGGNDLVES